MMPTCNRCNERIRWVKSKSKKWVALNVKPIDNATIQKNEFIFTQAGACFKVKNAGKDDIENSKGHSYFRAHWHTCPFRDDIPKLET